MNKRVQPLPPTLILVSVIAVALALIGLWIERQRYRLANQAVLSRALIDESPNAYIYWDQQDRETASPLLAELSGATAPGFDRFRDLFAPDDAARLTELTSALRQKGEDFSLALSRTDAPSTGGGDAVTFHIEGSRARRAAIDILWIRDITQEAAARADTAQRLDRAERERSGLQAMLDNLPLPAWRRRADLTIAQANRAYRAALGAATGHIADVEMDTPGEAEISALARRAAASGETQSARHHTVVGGARRLYEVAETPIDDIGLVGHAVDLTRVEELETDLARHLASHDDVLETLAVAIAIFDPDTKLAFYNTAFALLWDVEQNWLDTKPDLGALLEHLRDRRRLPEHADFKAYRATELGLFTSLLEPREELMHLPDGRTLRIRIAPHPLGGLLFTYEDVTDRLALEANYNTLINVQRQSLDNLYEAIALIGSDGKLKLCNAAFKRIWRLEDDDVAGEPHIAALVDKTRPLLGDDIPWEEQRRQAIAIATSRTPLSDLMELRDGTTLQHATVPLPDGMVLRTFLDISDRLRVEQALRERAEALEAADALKTEFIANVSYELRTPLNSIIGFTEILRDGMVGQVNEKQDEYLDTILQSGGELLNLINDILDLATIEAGYMELQLDTVEISGFMEEVHDQIGERIRYKNLELAFDCPANIGTMTGDRHRLGQILSNLAGNAIKFTPVDGHIAIKAARDGDDILFSVTDTGIGIPADRLTLVFDKFERGTDPMVRQAESGAGLGLSLVQSFVELHGGKVSIESQQNRGTMVSCRLPASGPPATSSGDRDSAAGTA